MAICIREVGVIVTWKVLPLKVDLIVAKEGYPMPSPFINRTQPGSDLIGLASGIFQLIQMYPAGETPAFR